ncbi:MAG: PCRF domain-containing protein, partial [Myxococcota bacterium]
MWQDQEAGTALQRERSQIERTLGTFKDPEKSLADSLELLELADEDEEIATEVDQSIKTAGEQVDKLELQRMVGGPHDDHDALISINAGAGGTESQDWAQMLLRMLLRWAERHECSVEMFDTQYGDEAGIKSAGFAVRGP